MEYDLDSGAHSTFSLHYHLILTTKYRCGVLTEERTQFIHEVISGFTDNYGVELTNLDGAGVAGCVETVRREPTRVECTTPTSTVSSRPTPTARSWTFTAIFVGN